jgi:thioredoxin-like negative regulator of GroEL
MAKTILWFSAPWCGPCKQLEPILGAIADDHPYDKIDVETNPQAAMDWGVRNLPTLVLLENSTEIGRSVGLKSEKDLREWIDSCSYETWVSANGEKPILEVN